MIDNKGVIHFIVICLLFKNSLTYNVDRKDVDDPFYVNVLQPNNRSSKELEYFNYQTSPPETDTDSDMEPKGVFTFYEPFDSANKDTPALSSGEGEPQMNETETKPSKPKGTLYFVYYNPIPFRDGDDDNPLDSWSVIWYIASFGGLVAFFLVVSCSEWCCKRNLHNANQVPNAATTPNNYNTSITSGHQVPETPPPSYDHFAPPSYESVLDKSGEKSEYEVYVVPVHTFGSIMEQEPQHEQQHHHQREHQDSPPSYLTINAAEPTRSRSDT